LANAFRFVDWLKSYAKPELKSEPETIKKCEEQKELVIPAPVFYEAFRVLLSHGKDSREWIAALGSQKIDGKMILTSFYDLECVISHSTSAELNY